MQISDGSWFAQPLELLPELIRFNFLIALDADSDWLGEAWMPLEHTLIKKFGPHGQFYASRMMLEHYDLSQQFDFDFADATKRIALLESKALVELTQLIGLVTYSKSIARVILGKERKAILGTIGEKNYNFAIKRGIYMMDEVGLNQSFPQLPAQENMLNELLGVGMRCLATVMQPFSDAVLKRMQFKFPRIMVQQHWQPLSDDQASANAQLSTLVFNESQRT